MRILIVGMDAPGHVGRFFLEAARGAKIEVRIADVNRAMVGNALIRRVQWRLLKRQIGLKAFSREVIATVAEWRPDVLLSTGICPLDAQSLQVIRRHGVRLLNYSTDDPWNPAHRSSWFLSALHEYDHIFSTRRANLGDFKRHGCNSVSWLPFAFDPATHYPSEERGDEWRSDVAFVGGADRDRVPVLGKLIANGYALSLWGGYWERFAPTRSAARGTADAEVLRNVISGTKCALTLVRKANRDGHAMRTFEVAAIGGAALAEGTVEHREILGGEGVTALYFADDRQLLDKCHWLKWHPDEASAMGKRLSQRIRAGANTYGDRLNAILSMAANISHKHCS